VPNERESAAGRDARTDEDLVRRARAGEEEAERLLFERHAPRLRAIVRRRLRGILRRKVGESDVLQEAYLVAHQRMADFDDRGDGSFHRWLSQILENKIRDELRRHLGAGKRDVRQEVSQAADSPPPSALARDPSPSIVAMREEERARVEAAMASLSDEHRLLLGMAHEQGLAIAEIARRLGKNADAVYKAYGRATQALARRLSAAEGAEGGA
jgi:RNA polymerase sigma-70 factor (ECF subfamily)